MDRRPLGRTGLSVSVLSLGTMTFGEQNTEAEGHAQMDRAVDAGIDLFDAAELYAIPPRPETQGSTERIIGSWIGKNPAKRAKVLVATKAVGRSDMTWFRDGGVKANLSKAHVDEAVLKSLKRLRTDVIDLYQIHWPDRATTGFGSNPTIWRTPAPVEGEIAIEETLAALDAHVRAGRIRFIGLSNESAWGTMRWLAAAERLGMSRVVTIQNAYSLVNRTFEVNLAEVALREQVGLLAYSPLAQGYLTGKYSGGALPQGSRKQRFDRLQRYEKPEAAPAIAAYLKLAADVGVKPEHLALKFAATRPFMTSVILGATTLEQLDTDIAALSMPWTAEIEERVDAIHRVHQNPCP